LFLQHEVAEKRLIDIFTQALLYLAKPTQLDDLFYSRRAWLRYASETIIGLARRGEDKIVITDVITIFCLTGFYNYAIM